MEKEEVVIDFDVQVLYDLMLMAHERDITLNQMIAIILRDYVERVAKEGNDT